MAPMVVSDRLGLDKRSPAQRTLIYAAAFGLGSLILSIALSWVVTGLAESMLAGSAGATAKEKAAASAEPLSHGPDGLRPIRPGDPIRPGEKAPLAPRMLPKTPASKAAPGRGNESAARESD